MAKEKSFEEEYDGYHRKPKKGESGYVYTEKDLKGKYGSHYERKPKTRAEGERIKERSKSKKY